MKPLPVPRKGRGTCPVAGCTRPIAAGTPYRTCGRHCHNPKFCECPRCAGLRARGAPSWEKCAAAGMSLKEAAAARGMSLAAGSKYASKHGFTFTRKGTRQ